LAKKINGLHQRQPLFSCQNSEYKNFGQNNIWSKNKHFEKNVKIWQNVLDLVKYFFGQNFTIKVLAIWCCCKSKVGEVKLPPVK
jgi:hypothetical protein